MGELTQPKLAAIAAGAFMALIGIWMLHNLHLIDLLSVVLGLAALTAVFAALSIKIIKSDYCEISTDENCVHLSA